VWHATVFSKNRDRMLEGVVSEKFFSLIVEQARAKKLLSDEHFTVDGTLIEAWAGPRESSGLYRDHSGHSVSYVQNQDPIRCPIVVIAGRGK